LNHSGTVRYPFAIRWRVDFKCRFRQYVKMHKAIPLLLILFLSISCGSGDERSEIEVAIYDAVEAAKENDVDGFMGFIDFEYMDREERTKKDIRKKVEGYLNRFRVIAVNILNIRTVKKDNDNADVVAEVNFSHGLGKMLSKVIRSYGESYRFRMDMIKRARGWVVTRAEWEWMSLEDLYPESIKVLRELFPDTF